MSDPRSSKQTPLANDPVGSLVGEFMNEKRREKTEEAARQAPRKRSRLTVPALFALCLAVWIAPSLMPPRDAELKPDEVERSARLTLYLASLRIRTYQSNHQRLPSNLVDAGVDTSGIVYLRATNSAFELSTLVQGARMVYRSTQPDSVFLGENLRIRGIG